MSRKLKNKGKKLLPKAQWGLTGIGKYAPVKYTPSKWRPNIIQQYRNLYPNVDIRGLGTNTAGFSGINELGMGVSDFANLTDYEKSALAKLNIANLQPSNPLFNNLIQNYDQFNLDKNFAIDAANLAVDFKQASPNFYMEVLGKGKTSPIMNEIFADPKIPIYNARNPYVGNVEASYGEFDLLPNIRDNYTGEFEKNLRSYGRHGFYANAVPLMGPSSFSRELQPGYMTLAQSWNKTKGAPPGTTRFNIETIPGYEYMDIRTPVADYVVNAGTMGSGVDPITNLDRYRGRAEMDNQHNFLLGRTDALSTILSGDYGFAGMQGGNTIRKNWSGISTPERGKNVKDVNDKVAPLLAETFNLNTPFQGTFMKFPYEMDYKRRIDGSMPGETGIWREYEGFTDIKPDKRVAFRKNFNWRNPMDSDNFFYPGRFVNADGTPFNVDFDYARNVPADPRALEIRHWNPDNFITQAKPNFGFSYNLPPTPFGLSLRDPGTSRLFPFGPVKKQWGGQLWNFLLGKSKPAPKPKPTPVPISTDMYRKIATERTHPVIGDYSFASMQGEYDWLQNAGQMSDKFITASNAMYDPEGRLISYDMPNLNNDGYVTLHQYFDTAGNENVRSLFDTERSIDNLLLDINKEGLFHLDLHGGNIMVKPGFGGTILDYRIIDPVGLPQITPDLDFSTFKPLEFNQLKLNLHPTLFPDVTQTTKFNNVMDFYRDIEKNRYAPIIVPKEIKYDEKGNLRPDVGLMFGDKKEGGELPKAQTGRFKFSPKVRKKMTTDGNLLNTKKLDKLLQRNYTSGEADYLKSIIKTNPSIVQGNFIDLNSLESLANNQAAQFKFTNITDNYDVRDIDGIIGRRTGWTDLNPNSTQADFNYYMYPELLPSHFSYINQGNVRSPYMQFTGNQILPTNFSIGMTGLNKPFLDSHHDGLHLLDPGAHGWMRGFVDQRFPNRYNLKELQTDINVDPMFTDLKNKSVSDLSTYLSGSKYRIDKYYNKINDLETQLANLRNKKNEIYGLDEYADEFLELERQEQNLMQALEYAEMDLPVARRLMENDGLNMNRLIQMSRIGFDPYSRLNNEAFSFLQDRGFNQIVLPNNQTIGTIQGWDPTKPYNKGQLGTLNYYNTLPNNLQLRNTGNTFNLENYTGNIFDLQRRTFPLFKEYGGQTSTYALDTKHANYKKGAEVYKYGGQSYDMEKAQIGKETSTYDQEYDMFENWLQEQEASWDYIKNTPSSVLKPDGKTYYMMFEDNKFYPYYFKNSDGTLETEATVGFGMKGADVYEKYKDGMSLEEAEEGRKKDIDNALRKTKIFIDANYGEGEYDKLDAREKFMLADFTYNLGRLSKYPNFADAIMTNNFDKALEHYIRKDEKGGTELARNDAYLNTYLQPWIISEQKRIAEEAANVERMNQFKQEQLVIPADNTMVGQNSFGGWKAGGETNKNKKMKAKDLAYFNNGGNLPKAQNGFSNFSLLNTEPYDPLMDQMRRMIHQNRIDTYYEPAGGQSRYNELQAWAQYQNALASGNESVINAYKALYPQFENLSYGDAFSMSRDATELAFNMNKNEALTKNPGRFSNLAMPAGTDGMPNFIWNNNRYGVEEGDDDIFQWRTADQIMDISNEMDQELNMDFFINNPDLTNASAEDYYNFMVDYYKDDKEKSRILRDIKKNNPDTYLDLLSPTRQAGLYNQFRTHQGKDKEIVYDPLSDENTSFMLQNNNDDFDYNQYILDNNIKQDVDNTYVDTPYNYNFEIGNPNTFEAGPNVNQAAVDGYLASKAFNLGPKKAQEWLKTHNAEQLENFKTTYGKSYFTTGTDAFGNPIFDEKAYNEFLEYKPGQTGDNRNAMFENIHAGMNNQIKESGIGSATLTFNNPNNNEESILNYSNAAIPEYLKDRRMALLNAKGDRLNAAEANLWGQTVPTINERSNQPLSWYEKNISKPWNDLGNWANAPVGAPPLSGFLFNTLDWAGDIARPLLVQGAGSIPRGVYNMFNEGDPNESTWLDRNMGEAQYYMPGKRLYENPNLANAGMVGLDAISVLPVGRAGSMAFKGLQGMGRNANFLTQGMKFNKGLRGNYNTLRGNYMDFNTLNQFKPQMNQLRAFDKTNPGQIRNYLNQKGPINLGTSPYTGRSYSLTGDMFSGANTRIGKEAIDFGTSFDKYKHIGTVPGYIGTSFINPENNISFDNPMNFTNPKIFNPNLRTTTVPRIK